MSNDQKPLSTDEFIEGLKNEQASVREIFSIRAKKQSITDERVIQALKELALYDPNHGVRDAARTSLISLGFTEFAIQKRKDFWIGVGLLFGISILGWLYYSLENPNVGLIVGFAAFFKPGIILYLMLAKRADMARGAFITYIFTFLIDSLFMLQHVE